MWLSGCYSQRWTHWSLEVVCLYRTIHKQCRPTGDFLPQAPFPFITLLTFRTWLLFFLTKRELMMWVGPFEKLPRFGTKYDIIVKKIPLLLQEKHSKKSTFCLYSPKLHITSRISSHKMSSLCNETFKSNVLVHKVVTWYGLTLSKLKIIKLVCPERRADLLQGLHSP